MSSNEGLKINNDRIPSDDEIVARANAMIPVLRSRILATEQAGQVSYETVKELEDAGFFRILQPKSYGGYEKSPLVFYRVLHEIAAGCPSTGWILMVLGIHNWEVALLGTKVADELWQKDDKVRISSSYAPFGTARKVDGGYQVSGTWLFSSGCDHATWAFLGAQIPGENGNPPDYRVFLIPNTEYKIIDDSWAVHGLSGTGSKSLEVRECFVPDYRTHSLSEQFINHGHDVGLSEFTNPYYMISFGVAFHNGVASVLAGMAKGMVQIYADQMQVSRNNITGEPLSVNPAAQRRIQIADSKSRQAISLIRNVVEGCETYLMAGQPIPLDKRAQYVADAATISELASDVSVLLFRGAGAKAMYADNLLGCYLRNIQCGCNHICMDIDKLGVNAGGTILGLPNTYLLS